MDLATKWWNSKRDLYHANVDARAKQLLTHEDVPLTFAENIVLLSVIAIVLAGTLKLLL